VVLEPLLIILIYSGSKTVTDGGFEPLQLTFSVVVAGSKLFYSKIEKFAYTMIMWSINTSRKMIYGNIHVFMVPVKNSSRHKNDLSFMVPAVLSVRYKKYSLFFMLNV
jgi:hypothetical protein